MQYGRNTGSHADVREEVHIHDLLEPGNGIHAAGQGVGEKKRVYGIRKARYRRYIARVETVQY